MTIWTRLRDMAVLGAVAIGLGAAGPAGAQSLGDALVSAYRHSALLDQNRAVLRASDEDVASAMTRLRPVINWSLGHQFQYTTVTEEWRRTSSATLSAQMTLFDWGRTQLAVDMAKESVMATRFQLLSVEQDVLLSAVRAFMDVRSATQQVSLQQASLRVIGEEEQAARVRFEVGEITSTDVTIAGARMAGARAALSAAEGQLEIAREAYAGAVGARPGALAEPPPLPQRPGSLEAAQRTAQQNHPAVLQAQRQVAGAELAVAAAAAERNPTLNAQAGLSLQNSPNPGGGYGTAGGAQVGIELSQTLYGGGRIASGHRQAMAQRDAARSALLNGSRQVAQAVANAWTNIDVTNAQIRAIQQQIEAARQAYAGVREEAQLGARTTLDVLDAEQSLLSAQADLISMEASLQLAHYQLLAAMGLLTVEHLQLGIPTYDPSANYNAVQGAPHTSSTQGESLDRVLDRLRR
ncbi:MAG: TolC family outer membrane protein [Paracoccus sp. (in: a-proteobacteria)]|nr:TolC family outer membrane protein [Paracoccus sp. (in: a-proteobacteria)]